MVHNPYRAIGDSTADEIHPVDRVVEADPRYRKLLRKVLVWQERVRARMGEQSGGVLMDLSDAMARLHRHCAEAYFNLGYAYGTYAARHTDAAGAASRSLRRRTL